MPLPAAEEASMLEAYAVLGRWWDVTEPLATGGQLFRKGDAADRAVFVLTCRLVASCGFS